MFCLGHVLRSLNILSLNQATRRNPTLTATFSASEAIFLIPADHRNPERVIFRARLLWGMYTVNVFRPSIATAAMDPDQDLMGAITEPSSDPVSLTNQASSRNLWRLRLWPIYHLAPSPAVPPYQPVINSGATSNHQTWGSVQVNEEEDSTYEDGTPQAEPNHTTGEEAPQAEPNHTTGEEAPQAEPNHTTGEEAPHAEPNHTTGEEAPQPEPNHTTGEEAPHAEPNHTTGEEAPQPEPNHTTAPQAEPNHTTGEEAPQPEPNHTTGEEAPQAEPNHTTGEEAPQAEPNHTTGEEAPQAEPNHTTVPHDTVRPLGVLNFVPPQTASDTDNESFDGSDDDANNFDGPRVTFIDNAGD
eukprot:gene4601-14793_t